ncbi:MAG: DUF3194 domain-containing protein [Candidatus Thorarchaeota archaeon]
MNPEPVEIGLPDLSADIIERLTEECEEELTRFILEKVPQKSVDELLVSCILELTTQLDIDIEINIVQKYDTGVSLDQLIESASEYGTEWLETRLREMKNQ